MNRLFRDDEPTQLMRPARDLAPEVLLAREIQLQPLEVDGRWYFVARARGWESGPCKLPQEALDRCVAWHVGVEIPEVPSGLATTAQMNGASAFIETSGIRGMQRDLVRAALIGGPHSAAWIRGGDVVQAFRYAPEIACAAPVRIRKSMP